MFRIHFLFRSFIFGLMLLSSFGILAQSPKLMHSYPFNDGSPTDIIKGANGIIHGDANIVDGAFVTTTQGQYLELPAEQIKLNTYTSISLEAFLTSNKRNVSNTMYCYFGNTTGDLGTDYIFQSMKNGNGSKTAISCKNPQTPWTSESSLSSLFLKEEKPYHVVTTFDNHTLKFYINGVLISATLTNKKPNNVIANIGDQWAYLCKSGYASDQTWLGSIDQFNIYDGVLDSATIAESAKKYLPELDLDKMAAILSKPATNMLIDESGTFDTPLKNQHTFFAEFIPTELDQNNRVDELLVFSDGEMEEWKDFSCGIRFSYLSGYVDIWDGDGMAYDVNTKLPVEIGKVYQCWIQVDVPTNTYSLFTKTVDQKKPVLIQKDAKFRNKVTELSHWSTIHNRDTESDVLTMNALTEVNKIGKYPAHYKTAASAVRIFDEKAPEGALVVNYPKHGHQAGNFLLRKLVITDTETSLYFRAYHGSYNGIYIPSKTFIKPNESEDKLFITDSKGIPTNRWYFASAKGYSDYKLIFPAIDKNTKTFEYGEANGGNWAINNIELIGEEAPVEFPISGNWFNTNNGDWEFSLLDSMVIFENKTWQISNGDLSKKKGIMHLAHKKDSIALYYKMKGDQLFLGKNQEISHILDHNSRYNNVSQPTNPPKFEKPIFKMDTATFSGVFHGYYPEMGSATGVVYVNNIITGNQENHLVKINKDGTFSTKIPITYPNEVFVRMDLGSPRLFLEPGKETFVMIDLKQRTGSFVMGANARLITEIMDKDLNSFYTTQFYREINNLILDMTPETYRDFCILKKDADLHKLNELKEEGQISDRFYQVKKVDLTYHYARNILHYHYNAEGAYREKNNIPRTQRKLPVSFEVPAESDFYNFLDATSLNDEFSLLGSSFENFINSFKYSPILRSPAIYSFSLYDVLDALNDTTLILEEDKELVKRLKELFTDDFVELEKKYNTKYGSAERKILKVNPELLQRIIKDKKEDELPILSYVSQLLSSDTLSVDDQNYCTAAVEYYSNLKMLNAYVYRLEHAKEVNKLLETYAYLRKQSSYEKRNKVLEDSLQISNGLVSDLFNAQDMLRPVVSELTPFSAEELKMNQQIIKHDFIRSYLAKANDNTLAKIEENKAKVGYTKNEVPETKADKLFDAIISKYKGKVIYVDFWATWCGPCRSSMEKQKPMKESLKEKNIVFVYITNTTSPEQTYNNMIPDYKGEHYRVSRDEWNHLTNKFNISGIPHYLIINKEGIVVDPDASRDPKVLIKKFEELY